MILAADIGATKSLLALYKKNKVIAKETYESRRFQRIELMLADFLSKHGGKITCACLGVAGPVTDNVCKATNLPWIVDGPDLSKKFRVRKLVVINDVEAMGYGLRLVKDKDIVRYMKKRRKLSEKCLIGWIVKT